MNSEKKLYTFYVIHCDIDERKYIGCTSKTIEKRWGDHCSYIRTNPKTPFHKEASKIGLVHFYYEVLLKEYHTRKSAFFREEDFINMFNSRDMGFNGTWSRGLGSDNKMFGSGIAYNDNFTNLDKNPSVGVIQDTSKPVYVMGFIFPSLSHAARVFNVVSGTIKNRCNYKKDKYKDYMWVSKDQK